MNTFRLRIIASDKIFFEGRGQILVVPGLDGEVAIMAYHENMIIAVAVGEIRFQQEDGEWQKAVVGSGFIHVFQNSVTLLVDIAERPEEIDMVRAQEALERAQDQLRQTQSIQEYYVSRASLARAHIRLKQAGKYEVK